MAYISQADLKGMVPEEYLTEALDDDSSGVADTGMWDLVATAVDEEIDGRLAGRFEVPISPVPDVIKAAAKVLAANLLYKRRGVSDEVNPWTGDAKYWKEKLDRIGNGKEPLKHDADAANAPAVLIEEDAKTYPSNGDLMV